MSPRKPKQWRRKSVAGMRIPSKPGLEFISRLPLVDRDDPTPLTMQRVARLIPGYCPWETNDGTYRFDATLAQNAIAFVHECCRHVKGDLAGQPLILELWQQAIVANVYGWVRKDDGRRRYVEVFEMEPRKQGKTTRIGAIVCKQVFADGEMGAEVYSAAAEREQAALVYAQASGMVMQEPMMDERATCYRALKSIEYHATGSFYRALSAEAATKHGFNASCWIMDELHAQKTRELLDVLSTSTGSRRNPLGWTITTRDFDGVSICNTKMGYAQSVRDGTIEDVQFLPVLYVIEDPKADWREESTWRKANPNFGVSVDPDTMRRDCHKAANEGPAAVATFKRLRLNMKTSPTTALFDLDQYDHSRREAPTEQQLRDVPCYGGLDLASTSDLCAFGLWWPGLSFYRVWTWCPEFTAAKRLETEKVPYLQWADDPLCRLTLTEGNVADYDSIEAKALELCERYPVESVAYDRWNALAIVQHLEAAGVTMTAFGQGYGSMSAPTKTLMRMVGQGLAGHEHNRLLRWCVSNTVGKVDEAGSIKPDKKRSRDKIDPLVSWVMAVGEAMTGAGRKKRGRAYRNRGVRRL